jgi:hypothetical protein
MNTNNAKGKLYVLVKCAAILLTATLISCEQKQVVKPKPAKVIQSVDRVLTKETELIIRHIEPNGTVLLGVRRLNVDDCRQLAAELEWPTYWLEGKASVNDPVSLILYYKVEFLESGEVRQVPSKWTVRSRYNQKYEDVFPTTSTGEKVNPGTQ